MTTARDLTYMRHLAVAAGLDMVVQQLDRQIARRGVNRIETTAITYSARQLPDIETRGA